MAPTNAISTTFAATVGTAATRVQSDQLWRRRRRRQQQQQCLGRPAHGAGAASIVAGLNTGQKDATAAPQELEKGFRRNKDRKSIRLALPSKGRMAEDTLDILQECQLKVRKVNPRQYVAKISVFPELEVWFQRASDIVRKLCTGDVDLGIVGYDMLAEFAQGNPDLYVIHDALDFGHCHLALGVPNGGKYLNVNSLEELKAMPDWTAETPLRVVTGYTSLAEEFLKEKGMEHFEIMTADGALEAAPAMGVADIILDLVSSGTTLRENNLREIEGGRVISSQGVFVGSRKALQSRPDVLDVAHEMLERLEAHLRAKEQYEITANMRAQSLEDAANKVLNMTSFGGLQGPTVSRVFSLTPSSNGSTGAEIENRYFSIDVIAKKSQLYQAVKEIRAIGGSGVLVKPLTYIFDEEPPRWSKLTEDLGVTIEGH